MIVSSSTVGSLKLIQPKLLLEQNHLFSDVILFFIHETTVIVLTAELDLMSD